MSDYQGGAENGLGISDSDLAGGRASPARETAVRETVDKTIGKVEGVVSKAFGEPAARRVREKAEATLDAAEDVYDRARSRVDARLAEEPYKVLAMAIGAGIVLGMMLGRRNHTIIYQPRGH